MRLVHPCEIVGEVSSEELRQHWYEYLRFHRSQYSHLVTCQYHTSVLEKRDDKPYIISPFLRLAIIISELLVIAGVIFWSRNAFPPYLREH